MQWRNRARLKRCHPRQLSFENEDSRGNDQGNEGSSHTFERYKVNQFSQGRSPFDLHEESYRYNKGFD